MDSSSSLCKLLPQWPIPRTSNSIYPALPWEGMDQGLPGRSRHHGEFVWFRWWFSCPLWRCFLIEMESSSIQVMGPQQSFYFFSSCPSSIFWLSFFFPPWWLIGEFYSIIDKCEEGFPSSRVGEGGYFFLVLLSATGSEFFFYGFQSLRWSFHKFDHKTTRIWSGWFFTPRVKKKIYNKVWNDQINNLIHSRR